MKERENERVMDIDFTNLRIEDLELIYKKAERNLRRLLLKGASWHEVKKVMKLVIDLSILLHKNKYPLDGETLARNPGKR